MSWTVAELGEGLGYPGLPLFLDQTETQGPKKFGGGRPAPPPNLRVWMSGTPLIWRSASATDGI